MSVQKQPAEATSSATPQHQSTPAPETSSSSGGVEFVALSRSVHVHRPKNQGKASKSSGDNDPLSSLTPAKTASGETPSAVVIMGWMDAPLRIVSKYAAPYAKLFPHATIIIKLSTGMAFMAGKEARVAALKGVIKVLEEVQRSAEARKLLQGQVAELEKSGNQAGLRLDVDSQNRLRDESDRDEQDGREVGSTGSGILVHSFSDGGASNLSQLIRLLQGKSVPRPMGIIFDCSPGRSTPHSASTAFSLPLAKRPYVRLVVRAVIYLYLRVLYMVKYLIGSKTWSEVLRSHLNSPRAWQWSKTDLTTEQQGPQLLPPRMYLYSKADALINWRAVEEHARGAAQLQGLSAPLMLSDLKAAKTKGDKAAIVVCRRWENAKHCDLGRADFDGYWTAVRSFVEASM